MQNIAIDNDMLIKLLELPPNAFELFVDPVTGITKLRIKPSFLEEQNKLIRSRRIFLLFMYLNLFLFHQFRINQQNKAIITEKNITMDDFDIEIDPITGELLSDHDSKGKIK